MGAVRPPRRHNLYQGRLFGSAKLWLWSISLQQRGHSRLANGVRNVNSILYCNSLPVDAKVSPDVRLAHHAMGTVIHRKTEIGHRVTICHNVTMAVRPSWGAKHGIVIEDDVFIGANTVIVTPRKRGIRIGRGARIGAGSLVIDDVPAGATVVGTPSRVLLRDGPLADGGEDDIDYDGALDPGTAAGSRLDSGAAAGGPLNPGTAAGGAPDSGGEDEHSSTPRDGRPPLTAA